jgi:hypothetical protein
MINAQRARVGMAHPTFGVRSARRAMAASGYFRDAAVMGSLLGLPD